MLDEDYKDFRALELLDSGEYEEIDAEIDNISGHFQSENVLLLVRYDLRRMFIWKGPKSPVRKRFISSRVGAELQSESGKIGMHLKIISVDAGDEPIEFLKAFDVDPYEVGEDEKLDDMYYIRNDERQKMEEEELKKKIAAKKKKKTGYVSYGLDTGDTKQAKKQSVKALNEIKSTAPVTPTQKVIQKRSAPASSRPMSNRSSPSVQSLGADQEKAFLKTILDEPVPDGKKRLNIVIGTSLYGSKTVISKIFGKEIESEEWDKINDIPDGQNEISSGTVRVYCDKNMITGLEILIDGDESSTPKKYTKKPSVKKLEKKPASKKSAPKKEAKKSSKKPSGKRVLQPIPKGE
jgi:hypothetical protein